MKGNSFDFLLHIGDIAYAVGHAMRWDEFFRQISPIATVLPYQVCIGNHEYDYIGQPFKPAWSNYGADSHGECGVPFNKRFHMPDNGHGNLWYSMDYPLVHITFMSSEHDWMQGSAQYKWIEEDLKKVNRTTTPWLIFAGHRPMYSSAHRTAMQSHLRDEMEDLLHKYKVDVALWGHVHNYERTCPVFKDECHGDHQKPGAPIHFVIGMSGAPLGDSWEKPAPVWSVFRDGVNNGYAKVQITRHSFTLQLIASREGTVKDSVVISKA